MVDVCVCETYFGSEGEKKRGRGGKGAAERVWAQSKIFRIYIPYVV